MSFGWNEPKAVEIFDPATKQARRGKATPNYIVHHPYGFRQEDIVHSLTIAMSELIDIAEAQALSIKNFEELKETYNAPETEEEDQEEEGDGSFDGEDTIEHSLKAKDNGEARGSIDESPNI